jgi:hypothetical protein
LLIGSVPPDYIEELDKAVLRGRLELVVKVVCTTTPVPEGIRVDFRHTFRKVLYLQRLYIANFECTRALHILSDLLGNCGLAEELTVL